MIVGLGLDLVAVERVERLLDRHGDRFLRRCFGSGEVLRPGDPEHLAGLLAAKEAAYKALGASRGAGIGWRDMVVRHGPDGGAPEMTFHGPALRRAAGLGVERGHLSVTHHGGLAAAVVILEGAPPVPGREE